MKISIITVAYNSGTTIADTLQSVASQTYQNIEHIVIDGGSCDNTLEQVRKFGSRVSNYLSEPDQGIYDAMNKGLRLARGDFVGFLNADDMLADAEAVRRLVYRLQSEPKADAVYSDLAYVHPKDLGYVVRFWRGGIFSPSGLKYGWMPPHPTFYVRRSLLSEVGDFDSSLSISADYDFMLRCLRRQGFSLVYSPGILVKMRLGGASNKSLKALLCKSREDLKILRRLRIGGIGTLLIKNLRKLPQFRTH